jgi:hypothetical protein
MTGVQTSPMTTVEAALDQRQAVRSRPQISGAMAA